MSWIQKLYETYDACSSMVGHFDEEGKRPLLPICHITAQADIEIVLDKDGNLVNARIITDRIDATTIIPCTEGSASRSGKTPECHPLCDNLQYVAGDFMEYGGTVTSGFADDPGKPYRNYIETLSGWCSSEFAHPKVKSALKYAKKKKLVKDLVEHKVLIVGSDGKLLPKREGKKGTNQEDFFVRWRVEIPGDPETELQRDKTVWKSWIDYYFSTRKKEPLCYVTGEHSILSTQHPKYIRAKGDGAKLISSNDLSGFTFRGRFLSDKEAEKKSLPTNQTCAVSLGVSQQAHNALIWLIDRQGKVFRVKGNGGRTEPSLTVVAWAASKTKVPQPTEGSLDILGLDDLPSDQHMTADTAQLLALKLRRKILGYQAELGETKDVQVMAMDSASKGRLAITYYRELKGSDYLERLEKWHRECSWIQHGYNEETQRRFSFVGAPAPDTIAEAAYGKKLDDKLKKATVRRILPCIMDDQQIPRDLVESVVRRASNRIGLKDPKDKYENEWNKTLSIACALFKKYNRKENYDMALDEKRTSRDYLYGRLLAIADHLEERALYKAKEKRMTNAARYMQRFAVRPNTTWMQIYLSLSPYMARLGGARYYKDLIDEVKCKFESVDEFNSPKPLSGEFLLAYHCQRAKLWEQVRKETPEKPDDSENETADKSNNNNQ
jgi:CRISPR-associated protein Csd1